MLIDLGADVNAICRTSNNMIQTPLDCALHKGYRSIAKYLQANGGLPASKIRLSARRQINTTEPVKPLKFAEKEEMIDLKSKSKRYVVYVKRSDSEESVCTTKPIKKNREKTRKIKCKCRHHRHRNHNHHNCHNHHHHHHHRRTASSCSDTTLKPDHNMDETELYRSKSNLEMHHPKSYYKRSSFSSSTDSSSGECDCDQHKCNCDISESKKRSRSCDKIQVCEKVDSLEVEETKIGNEKCCKHYKKMVIRKGYTKSSSENSDDTEIEIVKRKLKEYKKSLEILENKKKSLVITRSDTVIEVATEKYDNFDEKQKLAKKVDEKENDKPPSRPSSSGKKRPQSARASSAQRRKQLQQQSLQSKVDESDVPSEELVQVKPTPIKQISEENAAVQILSETSAAIQVITEAQVHAECNNLNIPENETEELEGIPSDGTFILDKPEDKTQEQKAIVVLDNFPDDNPSSSTVKAFQVMDENSNEKIEKKSNAIEIIDKPLDEPEVIIKQTIVTSSSSELKSDSTKDENKTGKENKSFMLLEDDDSSPTEDVKSVVPIVEEDNETNNEPSFTILDEDENEDSHKGNIEKEISGKNEGEGGGVETRSDNDIIKKIDDMAKDSEINSTSGGDTEEKTTTEMENTTSVTTGLDSDIIKTDKLSSFTVIDDEEKFNGVSLEKSKSVILDKTKKLADDSKEKSVGINRKEIMSAERNGRKKKFKKRLKSNKSTNKSDSVADTGTTEDNIVNDEQIQQTSRDQDSGFEPSPRAMKIKTASPSKKKLAFTMLDDEEQSNIIDENLTGRKPGDANACNMTTVSQSLQKNIKR